MESVGIIFVFVGYLLVRVMLGHHNTPTIRDRKHFHTLIAEVGKKDFAEALPKIEFALQQKADSAVCWALKAECHLGLHEYHQAIFYAEKALNIDLNLCQTHYHKGLAHYKLADYQEALSAFEKAIWHSREQFADAFYYKGLILLYFEQDEKAEYAFERAVKLAHEPANVALLRLQNHMKVKYW